MSSYQKNGFILKYECDCGWLTPQSQKLCVHCKRPNPDFEVSPSFMAGPVSKKSIIENEIRGRMRAARKKELV